MPESAGELRPRELIRPGTAVKRGLHDATPTRLQVRGRKLQRRTPKLVGRTLEQTIGKQPEEVDPTLSQVGDGVVQIDVRANARDRSAGRSQPDITEKQERDRRPCGRQARPVCPSCWGLRRRGPGSERATAPALAETARTSCSPKAPASRPVRKEPGCRWGRHT